MARTPGRSRNPSPPITAPAAEGNSNAAPRLRVSLDCPTPLAHRALVVACDDREAAWQAFCAANGISDSQWPRTIEEVHEHVHD
jgi:hypothetical protein